MRRTSVSLIALAVSIGIGGASVAAQSPVAAPQRAEWKVGAGLQADPAVRFGVLPNGMRYAIRRNATPPGEASLRLRIDTGSLNETEEQRGLAHFLEHMVLNGTKNVPEGEFVRRLERHGLKFGPDTNASTDFQETVYKLDLPEVDKDTVDTSLFLLREVADKAVLDPKAIDSERGIILAEERTRATPQYRQSIDEIGFLFRSQLLPSRIPIGTGEVIRCAPRERFLAFYNAYYRPENATLIAVGDFDVAEMEAKIAKQFGDWKGEGPAGRQADEGQIAKRGPEAALFVDPAMSTRVSVTWLRPADLEPDSKSKRMRNTIEGLGFAVLNRRLERIASTTTPPPFVGASAGKNQIADTGEMTQLTAVAQPGGWQKALATVEQEQRRLLQHGVSQAELDREITQLRAGLTAAVAGAGTRSTPQLAETAVASLATDRTLTTPEARLALFEETVKGLTPAKVSSALARLFTGSGPLLYLTSPTPVAGDKQALLSAYGASVKLAVTPPAQQQAQAWPYTHFGTPGQVAERRELTEVGATAVRFANGVRLTVKPTDFRKDQVLVQVRVGDGRLALDPAKVQPEVGVASSGFMAGGLKKLAEEDVKQALTGKLYSGGFGVSDDAFVLGGGTRRMDFPTQMQLLAAYVAEPGWRPNGWERSRSQFGTFLDQLAATPGGVFRRDSGYLLTSGDLRWKMPTKEQMDASTIEQARALLDGPLSRDRMEVVIVGDISVDEAIRQTAATFGALPKRSGTAATPGPLAFPKGNAQPQVLTHKGRDDQGLAFIGWPTTGFYQDPQLVRTLNVLASVFQLRLNDRIREQEGMSYSPQANHSASETYSGYGYLYGAVEAPPAGLNDFVRKAQEIADDLRKTPVSADEFQRAVKPMLERQQRDRRENGWWLSELGGAAEDKRKIDAITTQMRDYAAITPAALQRAAQAYLAPGKAFKLVVVPEAAAARK